MDISSLVISVPTVIAVVGCFIGVMNFLGSRRKDNRSDEARLVSMEKDIQYIRMTVDGINEKLDKHDERITHLEAECERRK